MDKLRIAIVSACNHQIPETSAAPLPKQHPPNLVLPPTSHGIKPCFRQNRTCIIEDRPPKILEQIASVMPLANRRKDSATTAVELGLDDGTVVEIRLGCFARQSSDVRKWRVDKK